MAKVLISFIGTGNSNNGVYPNANYQFNDSKELYTTQFIADAISRHYKIDKLILIGTAKSMWDQVYSVFASRKEKLYNETIHEELINSTNLADHNSKPEIEHAKEIEEALGNGSHIEIIRYGLNDNEINENISKILSLEKYLCENDEIIVDITHSFRSLPVYILNLLIYLENVSLKKLWISDILYGMLDVSKEFKKEDTLEYITPVVSLKGLLELNQWITGAYSFIQFGQGYQIADLVKYMDKDTSNKLQLFSNYLNLNYLRGIKNNANLLSSVKNKIEEPLASLILSPVIKEFSEKIEAYKEQRFSFFQLQVAKWQRDHQNYFAAYTSVIESIVSYVCEVLKLNMEEEADCEKAKKVLGKVKKGNPLPVIQVCKKLGIAHNQFICENIEKLRKVYPKANKIRNSLAHNIQRKESVQDMLDTLDEAINVSNSVYYLKTK